MAGNSVVDMQHARIRSILGKKCKRNRENAGRYLHYLQKALVRPCRLTGREDFPWEKDCLKKGWASSAYQEMRKEQPSFLDQFELLELLPLPPEGLEVMARVRRIEDRKHFEIELQWLECVEFKNENYQLLDDYTSWAADY